jgi:outer membrane protein
MNPNTDNLTIVRGDPIPAEVNGTLVDVAFFNVEGVTFPTQAYGTQLGDNFGQSVGLSLNIPIYSNHRNRINKERAQLGILNAELNSRQIMDQLKSDINTAITNFRAARNSFQAAGRSLDAADAAFNDAQRRFDVGAINSFEYNNAADNLDLARRELTRARYQMLFNLKVVEFYLGQPLSL